MKTLIAALALAVTTQASAMTQKESVEFCDKFSSTVVKLYDARVKGLSSGTLHHMLSNHRPAVTEHEKRTLQVMLTALDVADIAVEKRIRRDRVSAVGFESCYQGLFNTEGIEL